MLQGGKVQNSCPVYKVLMENHEKFLLHIHVKVDYDIRASKGHLEKFQVTGGKSANSFLDSTNVDLLWENIESSYFTQRLLMT